MWWLALVLGLGTVDGLAKAPKPEKVRKGKKSSKNKGGEAPAPSGAPTGDATDLDGSLDRIRLSGKTSGLGSDGIETKAGNFTFTSTTFNLEADFAVLGGLNDGNRGLVLQQLAADRAVPEHGASLAMGAGLHGGVGVEGALGGAAPPVTPALMFEGLAAVNRRNAVDPTEVGEAEPGGGGSHDTVNRIGHIFLTSQPMASCQEQIPTNPQVCS